MYFQLIQEKLKGNLFLIIKVKISGSEFIKDALNKGASVQSLQEI